MPADRDTIRLPASETDELARHLLDRGSAFRFRVRGMCMSPLITHGDLVTVENARMHEIRRGDVVFFKSAVGLNVHRVIRKTTHGLITQGDYNIEPDDEVDAESLFGRVVSAENAVGKRTFRGLKESVYTFFQLFSSRRPFRFLKRPLHQMGRILWGGFHGGHHSFEEMTIDGLLKGLTKPFPAGVDWQYSQIDPDKMLQIAVAGGTAPLVDAKLRVLEQFRVPGKVVETFRNAALATLARNMRFSRTAASVLESMASQGLEAVAVKGVALWAGCYKDIGLRPVDDMDILARREDVEKIKEILDQLGFKISPIQERSDFSNELLFVKDRHNLIELRWETAHHDRFRFLPHPVIDDILKDAVVAELDTTKIRIPSVEHQILLAAFHVSLVHHYERLIWLYDIVAIIETHKDKIDWERLRALASRYRITKALYYSMYRASLQFNEKLPLGEIEKFRPSELRIQLLNTCSSRGYKYLTEMLLLDNLIGVLKYLTGILYPSKAWLANHYQTKRTSLYRLAHPFLIAHSALKHAIS